MLRPVECWAESKIMSLSAYLTAAVYYFLYSVVDQKKTVANQTVADLFKVSKSNLHWITSGRKYAGGSITTGQKLKSVQELEAHGEHMVRIAKVKPKAKSRSQKKITMTKTTPKIYRFLSWRSRQGNQNLEVHGGEKTRIKRMMMRSQWFTKVVSMRGTLRKKQRDLKNPKVFKDRGHEEVRSRRGSNNSGEL